VSVPTLAYSHQADRENSITQQVYKDLHKNGLFRLETNDQTYCEDDKLFLADRFVEGTCPQCGYQVSYPIWELSLTDFSRTQEVINAINAP
jgi:leucyl-tRNA synthetase